MSRILFALMVLTLASCVNSPDTNNTQNSGSGGNTGGGGNAAENTSGDATIKALSNRPDLISAGDVLIEVVFKAAENANDLVLTRNGGDVSNILQATTDPLRFIGLVEGLVIGENTISASNGNSITVTNHPAGGPVFTGPQVQPWTCQEGAADEQCNQAAEISWLYKSSNPINFDDPESSGALQAYDPANPATDVATTTTDNGEELPFIVRVEKGFQARDRYEIRTLFKQGEDWTPSQPQSQWNGRLLVTHGGNCRGKHKTGSPKFDDYSGTIPPNPVTVGSGETALSLGWAVLSTSQLNLGHNCNMSYQAESLMMAKERFIEQYGPLRYTVGSGCSGGAITQNMIANAYPGLYQGLLTTCTYPDVMSTATQFADYHILLKYFDFNVDTTEPTSQEAFIAHLENIAESQIARDGTPFTITQQNAIYGHLNGILNASLADSLLFGEAVNPVSNCDIEEGVGTDKRYHPETNKAGARCDVLSFMKNIVGARERHPAEDPGTDRWSDIEKELGYGFAGFPLGNMGVQYGLKAMQNGIIAPEQFLQMNLNIGAVDHDLNTTATRLRPDYPALPNAYRSGIMNTIVNMDTVPIINMTGPDPGAAHDSVHGYWVRWRLDNEFGHHDNHVMWGGLTALIGDINYMNQSVVAMAKWLDAIEADTADRPLAAKIISNKPADVQDQCNGIPGQMCPEETMLVFGTPRTVAGADRLGDQIQCELTPFVRGHEMYGPANFIWGDAEWEQLEELFSEGVCDWSKRPLGWQRTVPWLTYQDELGNMITGGQQMAPAEFPAGWASPAFANTWVPGWQQQ